MSTFIFYNNKQIASGQPVPFVAKSDSSIRYGEKWANKTTITLNGQLTGCSYLDIVTAQNKLIEDFSKDFQEFEIIEDGQSIYSAKYAFINSIEFPQSKYLGILDYTVSLDCYQENLFSGAFGVLDPSDEWNYEETDDGLINATHTVSARGFNTSDSVSNSLQNAISFVKSRTGVVNRVEPYFITSQSGLSFCLKGLNERINRFDGTYSITETYIADKVFGLDGILRYTTEFDCNQEGVARVSVKGTVDGCGIESDIQQMRQRYSGINPYQIALNTYTKSTSAADLNPIYISSGVIEDIYNRKLNFNVSFDNISGSGAYLDYNVNIESGENGIINVGFDGNIRGRGDLKTRWDRVLEFYSGLDAYNDYAVSEYTGFGGNYTLNPSPVNSGVTFNKFDGSVRVNILWNDKDIPPDGFSDFSYTLNYLPPIQKVTATPLAKLCGTSYYVADLGYTNRVEFSVEGNGKPDCEFSYPEIVSNLNFFGNSLFGSECPKTRAVLETNEITTGYSDVAFTFTWSAEGSGPIAFYSLIDKLNL